MKDFNLEKAKAGEPVVTSDGHDAQYLYSLRGYKHLFIVNKGEAEEYLCNVSESGIIYAGSSDEELFKIGTQHKRMMGMKSQKKTVWVNVYRSWDNPFRTGGAVYDSKEEAISVTEGISRYVGTYPIEIEI